MFTLKTTNTKTDHELVVEQSFQLVTQLLSGSMHSIQFISWLDQLRELLDCVILDTPSYDLAVSRIRNARRFAEYEEFGAAKYELRLLAGGLKRQFQQPARRRRLELT